MLCFRAWFAYAQASPQNWDRGHIPTVHFVINDFVAISLTANTAAYAASKMYSVAINIWLLFLCLMRTVIWKEGVLVNLCVLTCNSVYFHVFCASFSQASTSYKHPKRPLMNTWSVGIFRTQTTVVLKCRPQVCFIGKRCTSVLILTLKCTVDVCRDHWLFMWSKLSVGH